jgi:hypothetical protein
VDVNRRSTLRVAATAGVLGLAGCATIDGRGDALPVTVRAVDVLNRRTEAAAAGFVAERGDDVAMRRTVQLAGAETASRPTGAEITAFAADPGTYRFRLDVDGGERLETTPTDLGVTAGEADCVRVTFVLNVDDRLTAHARSPCADD